MDKDLLGKILEGDYGDNPCYGCKECSNGVCQGDSRGCNFEQEAIHRGKTSGSAADYCAKGIEFRDSISELTNSGVSLELLYKAFTVRGLKNEIDGLRKKYCSLITELLN